MLRQSSADGEGKGENDRKERFHSTKYSMLAARVRLPDGRRDCNRLREISQPFTDAVIRVYGDVGNVIETHEHAGEFKEP